MRGLVFALAAAALPLILAACQAEVEVPEERGVCWHVVRQEGGEVRFNRVAEDQPNMEQCAARLEEMRVRFMRMGGTRQEVIGAYGGRFLFVDSAGVWLAQNLEGGRFMALRRTGDGRLAIPGAFELAPEEAEASSTVSAAE